MGGKIEDKFYDPLTEKTEMPAGADIFELLQYQRAIANFVRIACAKEYPVTFAKAGDSMTDGKRVVLSKDIDSGNFDVAVGLALHEGSHLLLTDFEILPVLMPFHGAPQPYIAINTKKIDLINKLYAHPNADVYIAQFRRILNGVEDRRIDAFMKKTCPGYVGYYNALYDEYFNSTAINNLLKNKEITGIDMRSYQFYIINFENPNVPLDILPGLEKIYKIMDLENIGRLKNTMESFDLGMEMLEVIVDEIDKHEAANTKAKAKAEKDKITHENENNDKDGVICDDDGKNDVKRTDFKDLCLNQKTKTAINRQEDFVDGKVNKKELNKYEAAALKAAETADASTTKIDIVGATGKVSKVTVTVIKKINQTVINSEICKMLRRRARNQESVQKGYRIGSILASKLKIRNEEYITKFNRQETGKVDTRLLAALGAGVTNIFERVVKSTSKEVALYISIDASASMSGEKLNNAITMAVAIARAAELVRGIRVTIDFRCAQLSTRAKGMTTECGLVLVAYDSKYDKTTKILKYFPNIVAYGSTPEGICFNAIMKNLQGRTSSLDSYFINLSDGDPMIGFIPPEQLVAFTKNEVTKIKMKGIELQSYFIGEHHQTELPPAFKIMYGHDSKLIDPSNIIAIAKSLNDLLSKRICVSST